MYSQNLPTLIRERENQRVAEELASTLEKTGKISPEDKKDVSEELTQILTDNTEKLSNDGQLSELIKQNHDRPIDYESGEIAEEEISNAGDFEVKIPKEKGKLRFNYSIAPIPSPESTTSGIEELYKIENTEKDTVDVTINENHSVFSTL